MLAFSLFGGVAADRLPKRSLLIATQSVSTAVALALGLLALFGQAQVWQVITAALLLGTANALDMPARQSFVVEMVGREDLLNAIALNSLTFNAARVIGPAVAGVIVATAGTAACFLVNAASFVPVIAALALMRGLPPARAADGGSVASHLREGFAYAARERRFQGLIALVAAASFFGFPCVTLLPSFARDVLHTDARGYGALMAVTGVGAIVSVLVLASRQKPDQRLGGGGRRPGLRRRPRALRGEPVVPDRRAAARRRRRRDGGAGGHGEHARAVDGPRRAARPHHEHVHAGAHGGDAPGQHPDRRARGADRDDGGGGDLRGGTLRRDRDRHPRAARAAVGRSRPCSRSR